MNSYRKAVICIVHQQLRPSKGYITNFIIHLLVSESIIQSLMIRYTT